MADKIKGITVQIGGDTTKLSSALSKANNSIKSTKTALQEVNKLLKLDPKNTDLLREKQKLLEQQITKTKDKLAALQQAQEQAKEMLANGEIDQGAYDNLTKKVSAAEQELQKLEQQAEEVKNALGNAFQEAGEKMQAAGEKITEVGQKLKKLSAVAAAGLGAVIKTTADFDASMSQVSAISGAAGSDFDDLREKAREMGETTKFSASEAADAMTYMAMAGWKTEDMLQGVDGVMNLAAASGADLATTSDIVTDALTAMGYSAQDAGHLADVMAAASSNANTNVELMGETFKYAAAVGGSYGYTMEDIALATGLMANAGIKGSQAGTALRSIMTRLATDAGASSTKLGALGVLTERLGVQFYDAEGNMRPFREVILETREAWAGLTQEEQASYANTIAGKNAMSGWLSLMNAAESDVTKLADAIDNSNGTAEEMAGIMQDNLQGQLTILKSQLSELAISIGDTMMPTVRDIVGKIQEFVDWLNSLDEETKATIGTVLAITAALAPTLIIIGQLITAVGAIMTILNPLTLAIGGVTAAMIVLGITAESAYDDARALNEKEQETAETVAGLAESYSALAEARDAAVGQAEAQATQEGYLWSELQKVVDENGKVKEGMEDRAEFLAGELATALGIEIDLTKGQIQNYADLAESIDTVIQKKKAQAILAANEGAYTEAIQNQAQAYTSMKEAAAQVAMEEGRLADAEKTLNDLTKERDAAVEEATKSAINATQARMAEERITASYEGAIRQASEAVKGHQDKLEELQGTLKESEEVYTGYSSTIQNYEDLSAAVISGDEAAISDAVLKTAGNFKTASTANREQLVAQRDSLKKTYEEMQKAVDEGAPNVTQKQVDEAKKMYELSQDELNKLPPEYAKEIKASAQSAKNEARASKPGLQTEIKAMVDMGDTVEKGRTWGSDLIKNFAAGVESKRELLRTKMDTAAGVVKKIFGFSEPEEGPLSDFHTYAPDMMKLFAEGISENKWRVLDEAQGLAADLKRTLNVQVTGGSMTAAIDNRTVIELDGRVVADVVDKRLGALV